MTGITVAIDRGALLRLGAPGQPVYLHMVRLGARIDSIAKRKLSNDMVNVRTGNLRSSQQPPLVATAGGRVLLTVTNSASYAAAVHDGTRAHDIYPVKGKVLTGWVYAGAPVFTPVVHHPGTAARPWLRDATAEALAAP